MKKFMLGFFALYMLMPLQVFANHSDPQAQNGGPVSTEIFQDITTGKRVGVRITKNIEQSYIRFEINVDRHWEVGNSPKITFGIPGTDNWLPPTAMTLQNLPGLSTTHGAVFELRSGQGFEVLFQALMRSDFAFALHYNGGWDSDFGKNYPVSQSNFISPAEPMILPGY